MVLTRSKVQTAGAERVVIFANLKPIVTDPAKI